MSSKRKENFSEGEKLALANGVAKRIKLIEGKFSASFSKETKENAWKEILLEVSSVGQASRGLAEIKKKYQSLKTEVKKIESSNRQEIIKTGGGQSKLVELNLVQRGVLEGIRETSISGISGGFDLSDTLMVDKRLEKSNDSETDFGSLEEEGRFLEKTELGRSLVLFTTAVAGSSSGSLKKIDERELIGGNIEHRDKTQSKKSEQNDQTPKFSLAGSNRNKFKNGSLRQLQLQQITLLKDQNQILQGQSTFLGQLVLLMQERNDIERDKISFLDKTVQTSS